MEFKDQYQHPEWQKKRLEILARDNFTCQFCERDEVKLNVHHKFYVSSQKVWQYHDSFLVTLCDECHAFAHENIDTMKENLCQLNFTDLMQFQFNNYNEIIVAVNKIKNND